MCASLLVKQLVLEHRFGEKEGNPGCVQAGGSHLLPVKQLGSGRRNNSDVTKPVRGRWQALKFPEGKSIPSSHLDPTPGDGIHVWCQPAEDGRIGKSPIQMWVTSSRRQAPVYSHIDTPGKGGKASERTREKWVPSSILPGRGTHSHRCSIVLTPPAAATKQVSTLACKLLITSKWVTVHYKVACN